MPLPVLCYTGEEASSFQPTAAGFQPVSLPTVKHLPVMFNIRQAKNHKEVANYA